MPPAQGEVHLFPFFDGEIQGALKLLKGGDGTKARRMFPLEQAKGEEQKGREDDNEEGNQVQDHRITHPTGI